MSETDTEKFGEKLALLPLQSEICTKWLLNIDAAFKMFKAAKNLNSHCCQDVSLINGCFSGNKVFTCIRRALRGHSSWISLAEI